jgi:hypothetical protein
MMLEHHPLA